MSRLEGVKTNNVLLLTFLLLTPGPAPHPVISLKCFTCSHHKGTSTLACPSSSSDVASFQTGQRYYDVGDSADKSCSIRVDGNGNVYHQGFTETSDCSDASVISHITSLVNKHSGTTGSRFICCTVDGCNWSQETAEANTGPLESLLTAALPFIIAGVIAFAVLAICLAVCCGAGLCGGCCGCLGCACCDRADKAKFKKTASSEKREESININDRYKSLARPGSESSEHTAVTPLGTPRADNNRESVSASSNKAKDNKITVLAAEESEETDEKTKSKEVNLKASQISNIDGVKNPEEVDNDRITKTARYYFQPAYKQS